MRALSAGSDHWRTSGAVHSSSSRLGENAREDADMPGGCPLDCTRLRARDSSFQACFRNRAPEQETGPQERVPEQDWVCTRNRDFVLSSVNARSVWTYTHHAFKLSKRGCRASAPPRPAPARAVAPNMHDSLSIYLEVLAASKNGGGQKLRKVPPSNFLSGAASIAPGQLWR